MITYFSFFSSYFAFIIDYNYGSLLRKCLRMKIFFYFLQQFNQKLTWMLWRQFHLGNNLPTHARKNKDFSQQKPRHLLRWISKAACWWKTRWHWFSFCTAERDKSLVRDENWINKGSFKVSAAIYVD